eukprot:Nk52_evm63s2657 gene=Nk52_evmTU63s2657
MGESSKPIESTDGDDIIKDEDVAEEIVLDESDRNAEEELLNDLDDMGVAESEAEEQEEEEEKETPAKTVFRGHAQSAFGVKFNPTDEDIVASGGADDKAILWHANTGEVISELTGFSDSVTCVEFSKDGKYVATGGLDGLIKVWNGESGSHVCDLEGQTEIQWLSWHHKGHVLLAGSDDGTIWMWKVPQGNCMSVFSGHEGPVTCGGFSLDGKSLITASEDLSVRVWDPKSGQCSLKVAGYNFHSQPVVCFDKHEDGKLLLTGSQDNSAKLVHLGNGKVVGSLEGHTESVETVAFGHNLPYCATGSLDGKIKIWDATSLRNRSTLEHTDGVVKMAFHPGSNALLLSCSLDGKLRMWDTRTGDIVRALGSRSTPILDFDLSQSGTLVACAGDDSIVEVFDI